MLARAAGLLGVLYAGVDAYWGAGGTGLLDTIGGTLAREGRAGAAVVLVVVWSTALLKLAVSTVGLIAVEEPRWLSHQRSTLMRRAAWLSAVVLLSYGGVLTLVGLLVQADILGASAHADQKALRWHAFLWDPWFLMWGLSLVAALALSQPARRAPSAPTTSKSTT